MVPERILRAPADSRADIIQGATWEDGVWTVEIARDLNTGNDDDIAFAVGDEFQFGVAIMDNGGGDIHEASDQYIMHVH